MSTKIAQIHLQIVQFACSAMPFCSGVYGNCLLVMDSCFVAEFLHLFSIFAASVRSNRLDAAPVLFENISEFEEAFADFVRYFRFQHEKIHHSSCIVYKNENISRFAKQNQIDPARDVAVDKTRPCSSLPLGSCR